MTINEIAALVSPLFIIGGGLYGLGRYGVSRVNAQVAWHAAQLVKQNADLNAKLITRLDTQDAVQGQTLAQAQKTNGRVDALEQQQRDFEREHSIFRERLSHVEGQAEVLLREKGQPL